MSPILMDAAERLSVDTGVSAEAAQLTRQYAGNLAYTVSASLDAPRIDALDALLKVYQRAVKPDWDGEGARAMQPGAVKYAAAFLGALPSGIPMPDVGADPDGDAYLEWDAGRHLVMTVTVSADGTVNYACLDGDERFHGVDLFTGRVSNLILEGIARVAGQHTR